MAEQVVLTNAHFQSALTQSAAMPHTLALRLLVAKACGRTGRMLKPEAGWQAMVAAIITDAKAAPVFEEPEVFGNRVGLARDGVSLEASVPSTSVTLGPEWSTWRQRTPKQIRTTLVRRTGRYCRHL